MVVLCPLPRSVGRVAHISGQLHIAAPPDTGLRHRRGLPQRALLQPEMRDVELLTPLPIGPGTRFLAHLGGGAGTEMLVEIVEFDRPEPPRLAHDQLDDDHLRVPDVHPCGGGTLMAWDWEVQPKGWLRA